MTGTFNDALKSDIMFIKSGEVVQYLLSASGNVIANVRLERSLNGGQSWQVMRGIDGVLIDYTGTALVPITGTIASGRIKNETPKDAWYRWNAVTFSTASSASVDWSLINAIQATKVFSKEGVCLIVNNEEPTDGVLGDGAGYAEGGSIYINFYSDPKIYFNNGTAAAPDWDAFA